MDICRHGDADTRLVMHHLHEAERGMKNITIQTVDSDILIIVLG